MPRKSKDKKIIIDVVENNIIMPENDIEKLISTSRSLKDELTSYFIQAEFVGKNIIDYFERMNVVLDELKKHQ